MRTQTINRFKTACFAGASMFLLATAAQGSLIVHEGWDLFTTDPGTTSFMGVSFQGVPLNTFDFGGSIGVQDVDGTDTIMQRKQAATSVSGLIDIELVALQLRSVSQVNLGAGLGYYYVTLQSTPSVGTMNITFGPEGNPHGTFDSSVDVFFDVRYGAINGPIVFSTDLLLSSTGTTWSHEAPFGALKIQDVNYKLDGIDTLQDFWPDLIKEKHPTGAQHGVLPSPIPEASTYLAGIMAVGFIGVSIICQRRREQLHAQV